MTIAKEFFIIDERLTLTMTDDISNNKQLSELVRGAHQVLLDSLGISGVPVREEWSLGKDAKDRPLLLLNLSDFTGKVEAKFAPDELEYSSQMRYRLHRLWGDLLQVRSHKQLKELVEADASEGDGNGP